MSAPPGTGSDDPDRPDAGPLRVPYTPWRRWLRRLRRRSALARAAAAGADPGDRVYLTYGVVLLVLVYGPMLWVALAQTGLPLGRPGEDAVLAGRWSSSAFDGLVVVGLCVGGLLSLLAVSVARAGGPLWTSPPEVTFALSGQFAPVTVLWRRLVLLAAGTGVVAAFGASALAAGALGLVGGADAVPADGAGPADVVGWALAAACAVQVPLTLGVAAQGPRRRTAARQAAGVLLGLGVLAPALEILAPQVRAAVVPACLDTAGSAVACPLATGPGVGVLTVAGTAALVSVWLAVRVLPAEIDLDATAAAQRTTVATSQALVAGEAGGLADLLGPRRLGGRGRTLWPPLLRRAPVVARDLLGVRRRVWTVLGAVVAGAGGTFLVLVATPSPGVRGSAFGVVLGAAILYAASASWAAGLRDMASQPRPGGLLPGGVGRVVAAHLVVPAALAALAVGVGLALAALAHQAGLPDGGTAAALVAVCTGVVVLAVRCWVCGATTVPAELFTPVSVPGGGDASTLIVLAWFVRGWLMVVGLAWTLHRTAEAGSGVLGGVAVVVLLTAAWFVRSAVRRLART
ncbi:hypothetical protein MWU57_07665 [Isoptericola sp. S6320L]|uniref:hypothetical protein n=1 Tax=Isoptericola sp. S6320L TaxID=2926411 RepID=UPI001FF1E304|nr:hypothetical protein [Isoptericola sp. S6320L]MCK0116909.1 hypothetical protein [Isoptericola sp. S6320L]